MDNVFWVKMWQGPRDALSYLCNDRTAREKYIEDKELVSISVRDKISDCDSALNGVDPTDISAQCGAFQTYIGCVRSAVDPCGAAVKQVIQMAIEKYLQPTAKIVSCPIDEGEVKSGVVQQVASSSSIAILLVFTILASPVYRSLIHQVVC